MIVKCLQCQHENTAQAKFCEQCAAPLVAKCPACGTPLSTTAKFCPECGLATTGGQLKQSRFASRTSYTPKHIAEKILSSRDALEGERKLVTVLFSDLKGSMELLDDRDPEEARAILDPVLQLMMDAVHYYEGTVSLAMGDGIMAIFGAPVAHEDHAVRACYSALRMQDMMKQHAATVLSKFGLPLQIRVGLNSGDVVVRSVGSDLHMDYTAVGETTHLAARMEQIAKPGSILLGPGTMHLAEGYVMMKPLGLHQVKGRAVPIDVYEALGATTIRSRLQAAAARGLSAFVGREAEMEVLRHGLERAKGGQGQIQAIIGEAGAGKSRLLWEIRHSHWVQNWLVIESRSVSYGKASSYLPVISLLKTYFNVEDADDPRKVREKVTGKLLTLDRGLHPYLSAMLFLLDIPPDDPSWDKLDPPQRRQQIFDGVRRLVLMESRIQPVLLVFEDLQWIDAETQALLDSLVEILPKARILLLVNYRPEYQHGWARKTYYREIRLDPLPAESLDRLLEVLLGNDLALLPLKHMLIERTEGNPFFLEESILSLVEMKFLGGEPGNYRLLKATETLQIPASAQAILTARIDRLATGDKRVLQAASVIGKDVPFALLKEIYDGDEEGLRASLNNLQAAEFLYETALFPDLEFTFRHALTQEVAYRSLVSERRQALHAGIVDAAERVYPDRIAERVDQLAHHAFRGEIWEKALAYCRQAGIKALTRSANVEGISFFDQALEALKRLPNDIERKKLGIELRFDLRRGLMPLGEFGRALDVLREAEGLATEMRDEVRLGWVSGYMTNLFWEMGEQDRALNSGLRALEIATAHSHEGIRDLAQRYLGRSYHAMGDYRQATEVFTLSLLASDESLRQNHPEEDSPSGVLSRIFLMLSLTELGRFAEALSRGTEALGIAERLDDPFSLSAANSAIGRVYLRKGEFDHAVSVLEKSLTICQSANIPLLFPFSAAPLGAAYARLGRISEALPLLEQAAERATAMRRMVDQALWIYWLSQALHLAGEVDRAASLAQRALELSVTYKERGSEAWVNRLLGDICASGASRDVEQAESYYGHAQAIARELGMQPLHARCCLNLGTLYEQVGRKADAVLAISAAHDLCRTIEMTYWCQQAETALARVTGEAGTKGAIHAVN
jgi:class 3 adenylate cyclase/tetratricopeptide (TPR) repeat protein